jgi:hypothetical protein
MRFVHGGLHGASDHDHAEGWRRTFAKLDAGRRHPPGGVSPTPAAFRARSSWPR